jgi:fructose-bisphosphate aldolase class II
MPIPTPEQFAAMLDAALDGGYAFPAVNVTSSQTLNSALRGYAEAGSDGFVQVTTGGAKYFSGGRDRATGGRAFAALAHELAADLPVYVALHTDHCPPEQADEFLVPLLQASRERVARGEPPLFNSHMYDGSTLPLEENLANSARFLKECRELGIVLEVEVGVVGGEEDGVGGGEVEAAHLYTTSEDLLRTAEVLGTGERGRYLLAATFGNVHGVYAPGHVKLSPEILREGQEALARVHPGARFHYVFHGSSGTSDEELAEAVSYGVVKVNVDTEMQYAFTRALADHVFKHYDGVLRVDGGLGDKGAFDPRAWGARAEESMAARVAVECQRLGSAGRSLTTQG